MEQALAEHRRPEREGPGHDDVGCMSKLTVNLFEVSLWPTKPRSHFLLGRVLQDILKLFFTTIIPHIANSCRILVCPDLWLLYLEWIQEGLHTTTHHIRRLGPRESKWFSLIYLATENENPGLLWGAQHWAWAPCCVCHLEFTQSMRRQEFLSFQLQGNGFFKRGDEMASLWVTGAWTYFPEPSSHWSLRSTAAVPPAGCRHQATS